MSRVRKLLLRTGVHHAPQGELHATPARIRHWADNLRAMRKCGIRVPIGWGHQPEALPGDANDRASKQYYLSRFNAGYVDDLDYNAATGELEFKGDIPGCQVEPNGLLTAWTRLPDGREVKTAVGEVSAAIRDWKDGQGREWPDSIVHVAITPLPVVTGQEAGFRTLATQSDGKTYYLSLSLLSAAEGETMADEPMETPEGDVGAEGAGGGEDYFKEGLAVLKEHGLDLLPPDTTQANFWERLCVAGHVKRGGELPEEPKPDEDEEDEGVSYNGDKSNETEEPRPVMMSLSTTKDPTVRKMLERQQNDQRKTIGVRISRLVKRGLSPAKAKEFQAQAGKYELSLTADGEPVQQDLERQLSLLEDVLPKKTFSREYLLNHAHEEPRPETAPKESQEEIKKRAERVSVASAC